MGSCMSKKASSAAAAAAAPPPPPPDPSPKPKQEEVQKKIVQAEETVKKEIFVIKQRKSHERRPEPEEKVGDPKRNDKVEDVVKHGSGNTAIAPVRTSSCTKEEVDAILIQCGRLSRSSSAKGGSSGDTNRKYSGSKRSYDFDHDNNDEEEKHHHHHQSRPSHRRTPSRERDVDYKRSGSRERCSSSSGEERKRSSGGRRVSRSPGRRSEAPSSAATATDKSRPGKMVSVPASVSTRDKTNPDSATMGIKRVSVKSSGEVGHRTAASPRSQSPANARASNENAHQKPPSLSRNSSRKAEHSPYKRNPLNEIDDNSLKTQQVAIKAQDQKKVQRKKEADEGITNKKHDERNSKVVRENIIVNCKPKEQQQPQHIVDGAIEAKGGVKTSEVENLKCQTITRSRSSRRSRDLDLNLGFNPDTILNPTSYASLLLEDIQNFHQQNTTAFSLPPCLTKACSILDAVADLNSCASSDISSAFSKDRSSEADRSNNNGKRRLESKDPFVESEIVVSDDLMEPSIHKYVTVRRGMMEGEMEQQEESSGSNSFVGQQWVSSSSSWEPNSADSIDCWTSRSNTREQTLSEGGALDVEVGARRLRHGKVGGRGQTIPISAAAAAASICKSCFPDFNV